PYTTLFRAADAVMWQLVAGRGHESEWTPEPRWALLPVKAERATGKSRNHGAVEASHGLSDGLRTGARSCGGSSGPHRGPRRLPGHDPERRRAVSHPGRPWPPLPLPVAWREHALVSRRPGAGHRHGGAGVHDQARLGRLGAGLG